MDLFYHTNFLKIPDGFHEVAAYAIGLRECADKSYAEAISTVARAMKGYEKHPFVQVLYIWVPSNTGLTYPLRRAVHLVARSLSALRGS